jgi:Sulfotransferase domain
VLGHHLHAIHALWLAAHTSISFLINTGGRLCPRDLPTIFHLTHYKAGSQWIYHFLRLCLPHRIVEPDSANSTFLSKPLLQSYVYPTLYLCRETFFSRPLPKKWYGFLVIRDLRDTLVSGYFSLLHSHRAVNSWILTWRAALQAMDQEAGLLYMIDNWLPTIARIQSSWLGAEILLIRYEDLLHHDLEIFSKLLLQDCKLPIREDRFKEIVLACRFESVARGRLRGEEDLGAHHRKAIAGDWRNHFSEHVKDAFKEKYGDLLIATGYESGYDW